MPGPEYFCTKCKWPLPNKTFVPNGLNIKRRHRDLFRSYEGHFLVSPKAKPLLEKHVSSRIKFFALNKDQDVFMVDKLDIVEFDSARRETQFIKLCEECSSYEEVIGAKPAVIKNIEAVDSYWVYFTDLWFGSEDYKSPNIVMGEHIFKILADSFKEVFLEKAYGPDDICTLRNGRTM